MDTVLKAAAIYLFLLVVMRLAGRRTLAEMTSFDLILLLIIGDASQQALLGDDFSLTNAMLCVLTLVVLDIGLSLLKRNSRTFDKVADGVPMLLVEFGVPLKDRMERSRVDEAEVLEAARRQQGLERMSDIRFAVLEVDGRISVIPQGRPG